MRYNIAGLTIDFFPDFSDNFAGFEPFASESAGNSDAEVYFQGCSRIEKPAGPLLFDEYTKLYRNNKEEDSYIACIYGLKNQDEIICRFDITNNWSRISVQYLKSILGIENAVVKALGHILLRNLLTLNHGILIHASAVEWNGIGLVFSAPSGTGKSTHTKLWETYFGARVINDDAPALKLENNKILVYGTPWSGTHEKHLNAKAPLAAIVVLEQNPKNEIRKLTISEITAHLLPRFLLPYYDNCLMGKAMDIYERIVVSVPIYLLKCRPDREAAEMVHRCVISSGINLPLLH